MILALISEWQHHSTPAQNCTIITKTNASLALNCPNSKKIDHLNQHPLQNHYQATMSLMKSIFGDAAKNDAASDLFHSPVITNITTKKPAAAAATNKSEEAKNQEKQSKNDEETEIQADNGQSSLEEEHNTVDKQEEEERTIFVGNLPSDISRKALANIFKDCGKVASSRLRSVAVAGVKLPAEQVGNQVSYCDARCALYSIFIML